MVTGNHWLPELWSQSGYRVPRVTRIMVSELLPVTTYYQNYGNRWLPVTIGYQNYGLRVVTGYHELPELWSQGAYRLPSVTIFSTKG